MKKHLLWLFRTAYPNAYGSEPGIKGALKSYGAFLLILLYWHLLAIIVLVVTIGVDLLIRSLWNAF